MPSFLHSGDLGDIMYALPTIKHLGGGRLYLTTREGTREPMTGARFEFIKPLLLDQDYIESVEMHHGQKITHDFTGFREGHVPNVSLAEIQRRHVQPLGARPDFSKPWIEGREKQPLGRLVMARSARYRNPEWSAVWPSIIRLAGDSGLFIGTKEEHANFCEEFGDVEYKGVNSAREMAEIIAKASLFAGNQSFPYSIAEGLKQNRVLEVCPRAKDCLYAGGEVLHVLKAQEWPETSAPRLLMALQLCPDDYHEALDLANLIVEIEPKKRDDTEIAVCIRDDVPEEDAETLRSVFENRFKQVHVLRSRRGGRGWPDGCNDLWQASMVEIGKLARSRHIKAEAVLTFEPDCIPGRGDWISQLGHEWAACRRQKKLAFGHIHEYRSGASHMNGNMVLDINAIKMFPELQTSSGSWDVTHSRLFCNNGIDSPLIRNLYKRSDMSAETVAGIIKGSRPALIHGIKTSAGRDAVRMLLREGKL